VKKVENYALLFTNYIKIEAVSFLDEFDGGFFHNIEEEHRIRMREVRQITAPIVKRIKQWKDLRKFRNHIIAHPWKFSDPALISTEQKR
jgi:hypothetical protein